MRQWTVVVIGRELSWCQLCSHWQCHRLSCWQPAVLPVTAELASWIISALGSCELPRLLSILAQSRRGQTFTGKMIYHRSQHTALWNAKLCAVVYIIFCVSCDNHVGQRHKNNALSRSDNVIMINYVIAINSVILFICEMKFWVLSLSLTCLLKPGGRLLEWMSDAYFRHKYKNREGLDHTIWLSVAQRATSGAGECHFLCIHNQISSFECNPMDVDFLMR